ncbi:MAG: SHOCT-like domain-containing protein [bacterium]|jgi:hypothetical protein
MSDEKMRILEMVREGKISASEGLELISALDENLSVTPSQKAGVSGRFLRVRVSGEKGMKVNVNIPIELIKIASRLAGVGFSFIPPEARAEMDKKGIDLTKMDIEEMVRLIDEGMADMHLVDADIDDPKEGKIKVEVYVG